VSADIKFCGLTRAEDAEVAVSLGASYVGVIFAGGPRSLTLQQAIDVLAVAPTTVRRVGVFADQTSDEIARTAERLELSVVQLHGTSSPERIAAVRQGFSGGIWPVCRVSGAPLPADVADVMSAGDGLLLDAFVPGALGGSGVALPWDELSSEVAALRSTGKLVILAGGLRPENVARAIATLAPDVVDVSSGVERSPGIKDHDRMRAFRDAVAASVLI
jgi:phosphoribosylanthranilate isomerase